MVRLYRNPILRPALGFLAPLVHILGGRGKGRVFGLWGFRALGFRALVGLCGAVIIGDVAGILVSALGLRRLFLNFRYLFRKLLRVF